MQDSESSYRESMLEVFLFETTRMVEQLEELLIGIEKEQHLSEEAVNEIFRIMHTVKGSSAMMMYDGISHLSHTLEDLFSYLRSNPSVKVDCHRLADIVLMTVDFIKSEMAVIENHGEPDGDNSTIIQTIHEFQKKIMNPEKKQAGKPGRKKAAAKTTEETVSAKTLPETGSYTAEIFFDPNCEMENMRAYTVVHQLEPVGTVLSYTPSDILENEETIEQIRQEGFRIYFTSSLTTEQLQEHFSHTLFLEKIELRCCTPEETADLAPEQDWDISETGKICKNGELEQNIAVNSAADETVDPDKMPIPGKNTETKNETDPAGKKEAKDPGTRQGLISVNVKKLDVLMDLVGELVIAEAMVTKNPDLEGLQLDNFNKATRQLSKLTNELQDAVMSMRLIPIAGTFQKMNRLVRDMKQKLGKEAELDLIGEETEIDKNIADHLADPLMHLIRNSLDHGLEDPETRVDSGKNAIGKVTLEAKNAGGEVWITVQDDGRGLDKNKIYTKAREKGLVTKSESEYTEKEIYSFIMLPGFSTKEQVTEFSGRGVGMDVVRDNISKLGGSITIESRQGYGTTMRIRIPLTLAIIDGMLVSVGTEKYIIPTTAIRESFRANEKQVIRDTEDSEMIMIRGNCYRILRLHERLETATTVTSLTEGIIVVIEDDEKLLCLFADALIGKQQVVVKPIPQYIRQSKAIAGCTILGDGNISLILDAKGLVNS